MRLIACFFFAFSLLMSSPLWAASTPIVATVTWVYDGDTVKLQRHGKVRLLGIDSPEGKDSPRDNYYLKQRLTRETLRRVAAEAKRYLIRNIKGRQLTLHFDREQRDRHGRLLAYAYLPDGRLLNRMLLEKGLAAVYRKFDFALKEDFLQAEDQARKGGVGLWAD